MSSVCLSDSDCESGQQCHDCSRGGAVYVVNNAGLQVYNSSFTYNNAVYGSAIWGGWPRNVEIQTGTVAFNTVTAPVGAGAICVIVAGSLDLTDITFANNGAPEGAAILVYGGVQVKIYTCTFISNRVSTYGGAISVSGGGNNLEITDTEFTFNQASSTAGSGAGGSLSVVDLESLIVKNTNFERNQCGAWGGAITARNVAKFTIDNGNFDSNLAHEYGGAIYVKGCESFKIYTSTFDNNTALLLLLPFKNSDGYGGAIFFARNVEVVIDTSKFVTNRATGAFAQGGSLYIDNSIDDPTEEDYSFEIDDSTFTSNCVKGQGGAIGAMNTQIRLSKSVFELNQAGLAGDDLSIKGCFLRVFDCVVTSKSSGTIGTFLFGSYLSKSSDLAELRGSDCPGADCPIRIDERRRELAVATNGSDSPFLMRGEPVYNKVEVWDTHFEQQQHLLSSCSDDVAALSYESNGTLTSCSGLEGLCYNDSVLVEQGAPLGWFSSRCCATCGWHPKVFYLAFPAEETRGDDSSASSSSYTSVELHNCSHNIAVEPALFCARGNQFIYDSSSLDLSAGNNPDDARNGFVDVHNGNFNGNCSSSASFSWLHSQRKPICNCGLGTWRTVEDRCADVTCTNSYKLQCSMCPAGQYTGTRDAYECSECAAGKFQPSDGSTSCLRCPSSKFQDSTGKPECTDAKQASTRAPMAVYYVRHVRQGGTTRLQDQVVFVSVARRVGRWLQQGQVRRQTARSAPLVRTKMVLVKRCAPSVRMVDSLLAQGQPQPLPALSAQPQIYLVVQAHAWLVVARVGATVSTVRLVDTPIAHRP
jgi:predicted outer membrane repeat protein